MYPRGGRVAKICGPAADDAPAADGRPRLTSPVQMINFARSIIADARAKLNATLLRGRPRGVPVGFTSYARNAVRAAVRRVAFASAKFDKNSNRKKIERFCSGPSGLRALKNP